MPTPRKSRQNPAVREFILRNVSAHPGDVASFTAQAFSLSRAAINRYVKRIEGEGLIEGEGKTTARQYKLKPIVDVTNLVPVGPGLQENDVWAKYMEPHVGSIPQNVKDICYYGFSEMFNNVIDHSKSSEAIVRYIQDYVSVEMCVLDHGVGIFEKIQKDFDLPDQRTALLELAKGKLTSDSKHHSGEGIFFSSRMFDEFSIKSGDLYYRKKRQDDWGWLIQTEDLTHYLKGTYIVMKIATDADWTTQQVFEKFTAKDDEIYFIKTHVPVSLGKYGTEQLVSRSQAKRVLSRFDRFKEVLLDFSEVATIGQPFADEIFRVFVNQHPDVRVIAIGTTPEIDRMIAHVRGQSGGLLPEGNPNSAF